MNQGKTTTPAQSRAGCAVRNLRLEKDFGEGFKSVPRNVLGIARKNAGWESSEDFFSRFFDQRENLSGISCVVD
jgi:hypothetical protein